MYTLYNADAFALLRELPDNHVNLIATDPPYESLEKHRRVGTTTRLKRSKGSSNDWFPVIPNERLGELLGELYRVLKPNSHAYVFSDSQSFPMLWEAGVRAGFRFWKPLVWDKEKIGMGYHYRATYEFVLFFEKGKRKLNDLGQSDILRFPRLHNAMPAEKPRELLEVLIKQSSNEGELVLDPFMGSGSTGHAAVLHKRQFLGVEIKQDAYRHAASRIAAASP